MRSPILLAASALLSLALGAQPALAQSYHEEHVARQQQCTQSRNGNTAAGAVVGGILGAVLGSQVAARGHRTDGSVLGGVLGAAAGAAIGNSSSTCDPRPRQAYDPYYGRPQGDGRAQDPYYGDDSGLDGGAYEPTNYGARSARGAGQCRWGEAVTRDPDGYEYRDSVYMCRGRDGVWRAQ